MKSAVVLYLSLAKTDKCRGFLGLNGEYGVSCRLTGFLPLHAVVACGFPGMYDFLCDLPECGLDDGLKGNEKLGPSGVGMLADCAAEYGVGLTPLQTACQLGSREMFKHIIHRNIGILWKWGPVTQQKIDLDGIDSAPGKGGEVLELIGRFDAKIATQEFLLDDFMEGFLHRHRHGEVGPPSASNVWVAHRLLDVAYLTPLIANALWLKEDPLRARRDVAAGLDDDHDDALARGGPPLDHPLVLRGGSGASRSSASTWARTASRSS